MTHTIGDNNYEFVNESFSNSRNWGHKSKLYRNNQLIGENKSIYLNRTWESYQYQSCMKGIVYDLMDENLKEFIQEYKDTNGIKRLAKAKREELEREFKGNEELQELLNKL